MAAAGEEELDYESDPEEAKPSLGMRRRRAASDDEESEGEVGVERERADLNNVGRIHSDESDGQGGAEDYDEEEDEYLDDEGEEIYDEGEELIDERDVNGQEPRVDTKTGKFTELNDGRAAMPEDYEDATEEPGDVRAADNAENQEEEKKENEPYAVPTAGAFYMHDDRFRDNAGGRHRRTFGGRKLWESKDDRKWGHDKFEEMTMQDRHHDERRRPSKGHSRARGRHHRVDRGDRGDRGYVRGNRSKTFENNNAGPPTNSNNQSQTIRGVRGRGPRRYEPSFRKNNQASPNQNKLSAKSPENPSHDNSGQSLATTSNIETDPAPARKHAFGSSLNSASPPFYPSSSANTIQPQKKDVQAGNSNRNNRAPANDDNFVPQSSSLLRGKNISNSMEKLSIDDVVTGFAGKPFTPMQSAPSGSSSVNSSQSQSRSQGRGAAPVTGQMSYHPNFAPGQISKTSQLVQAHAGQRGPLPNRVQPCINSGQSPGRPGSGSQVSSPPKTAVSVNSYETGESECPSEASKSKGALVGKGKGNVQGSGRGSFLYGGPHVMGAGGMGVGRGDQNFSATPAFLPVMQFGGQHTGGIGVPAVGMAFPGYVAQPQLGLGNSEMTWLPVLAGAAGALGATYCSPYIAVDGAYHTTASGQTTTSGTSSKESNTSKPDSEWKPSQGTEAVSEEAGQRQNKPRRYSEMNFGQ